MNDVQATVQQYYGDRQVLERILDAVRAAGGDPENLTYEDLHFVDQLHSRGVAATREHAEQAGIGPGMHVLEVGSGVGGASRYLAANCNCRVTAIDLTQAFVDAATDLTARCGLSDRIEYRQANALDLPFEDGSFDHVWSHNVTMNIEDKAGFAKEVARVLKPGRRFSCSETALGSAGEPTYPLPWASEPSSSFLATPEAMRSTLEAAGLRVVEQTDITPTFLAFAREMKESAERGEPPAMRPTVVMGDSFPPALQNAGRCAAEGRLVEQFIIAEKA